MMRLYPILCFVLCGLLACVANGKGKKKDADDEVYYLGDYTVYAGDVLHKSFSKLPDWVKHAIALPKPPLREKEKPNAIVIWDEERSKVLPDGRVERTLRLAIRLLDNSGRWRAKVQQPFYAGSAPFPPNIEAWSVKSNGEVHEFKRKDIYNRSASGFSIASDRRVVGIDGNNHTFKGDVFAWECTRVDATIFTQSRWYFQSRIPVAYSKYKVDLPKNWSLASKSFDGGATMMKYGNSYVWEMRNLMSKAHEPHSPSSASGTSRIVVNLVPPADKKVRYSNLKILSWKDLSDFIARGYEPVTDVTPEMKSKVSELISDSNSLWEKVQGIGHFSQNIGYISISLNLGDGGGYIPRPASETFKVGYGDCKDKATLMRSLLREANIESYPVIVHSRDNDAVREEWPGDYFNHCILAVEVDESVDQPAVLEDPELGRLLFVDPTSPVTPMGELPFKEQGGLAVLGKAGLDRVVRIPLSTPDDNIVSRKVEAEFVQGGVIRGRIESRFIGEQADSKRSARKRNDEDKYLKQISDFVAKDNPTPKVLLESVKDNAEEDRSFEQSFIFVMPAYGKFMGNGIFVFKPAIVGRQTENPFQKKKRKLPVRLRSRKVQESAQIYLPIGYVPEEYREAVSIEEDFASYEATMRFEDDKLVYERTLEIQDVELPVERYEDLRKFYADVIAAEQSRVVLARAKKES